MKAIVQISISHSNSLDLRNFLEKVTHWTGKRNRGQEIPHEMKTRWFRLLA